MANTDSSNLKIERCYNAGEVDGSFDLKKRIPKVYNKIKSRGIDDLDDIFKFKK